MGEVTLKQRIENNVKVIAIVEDDNLDGVSLFKLLRGYSSTKNTPIIVITGSYDWELHRLGLQGGWLLHKPFEIKELLEIVHALLPVG